MRIDFINRNQLEVGMLHNDNIPRTQPVELTPRDDVRKVVSEALKRVDNFIRKGDLDQAEQCVVQAREIDPKNIYAFAFLERINLLKEQARENSLAAAACKATGEDKDRTQEQTKPTSTQISARSPKAPLPLHTAAPTQRDAVPQQQVSGIATKNMSVRPETATPVPAAASRAVPEIPRPAETVAAQQAGVQKTREDERSAKIQQMIKVAVEAVRKEVEQKQMEIRAHEREEFARREQLRIKEAAEEARRQEEQRQTELRKDSEGQLQEKIHGLLRQKLTKKSALVDATPAEENFTVSPTSAAQEQSVPPCPPLTSAERSETLERYKLVLSSVWADGAVSAEEDATLKELRKSLSVSPEEHTRLEQIVKHETYIQAFKKAWNSGTITPENASVLAELRARFHISNEEHLKIESKILWEIQPVKNRPMLLVVDDDERLLNVVSKTLNEAGFTTTPVTTSDEAYAYLKDSSPDLILCDVNLETSTMGGFAFYEKVRELDRLRETPFIFLSGLTDEALVRTGKELGVDDYLSKPVSEETLVATIRGKLKRYQELRKQMN
jgi:CheY-like chemotaxis protein